MLAMHYYVRNKTEKLIIFQHGVLKCLNPNTIAVVYELNNDVLFIYYD